jgi:hypothetical protein
LLLLLQELFAGSRAIFFDALSLGVRQSQHLPALFFFFAPQARGQCDSVNVRGTVDHALLLQSVM